jgi:hypothetical protein
VQRRADSGIDHFSHRACAACTRPGAWAWTSSASQFCNPDEVSDSAACGTPASYSTTGAPDGNYRNAIFLNSRGACTVPTGVLARRRRVRPPTGNACPAKPDRRRVWILPAERNHPVQPGLSNLPGSLLSQGRPLETIFDTFAAGN